MNWLKTLNESLDYIENNITEEINCEDVAIKAYSSYHHYLRLFNILSGIPLSEYIRNRRLTLAATDLIASNDKIIDIALKYQYKTPEAFSKAFKRFHGISPSEARRSSAKIRNFSKMSFQLNIRGDKIMEYVVVKQENLTFTGIERTFTTKDGQNFKEIPVLWQEVMQDGTWERLLQEADELGVVGMCYDFNHETEEFKYMIGIRKETIDAENMVSVSFKDQTFASFTSKGALPQALQSTIQQVFSEWFPSSNYEHSGGPEIEVYAKGDASKEDYICYFWVPIQEKK